MVGDETSGSLAYETVYIRLTYVNHLFKSVRPAALLSGTDQEFPGLIPGSAMGLFSSGELLHSAS